MTFHLGYRHAVSGALQGFSFGLLGYAVSTNRVPVAQLVSILIAVSLLMALLHVIYRTGPRVWFHCQLREDDENYLEEFKQTVSLIGWAGIHKENWIAQKKRAWLSAERADR